ncbi:holo-ACP synthase [Rubneribacter badeniensis]|uniref:holo-ACP synthase n=1 Tax=Rubneribacter badeniensis TaxID=2070688 RepID=UPI003A93017F
MNGNEALEGQVGLGVDIVEIARMRRILERTPRFRERVFSEDERAYCDATANPETHYATRFAAKEAVVKALGTGFSRGIDVRDIEVRRNAKGRPVVALHGRAREVARELGVRELPVSLSFTHTEAVACAMAITENSVRAAEKRVDPMEELSRQFKEARALLDEMDAPRASGAGGTKAAATSRGIGGAGSPAPSAPLAASAEAVARAGAKAKDAEGAKGGACAKDAAPVVEVLVDGAGSKDAACAKGAEPGAGAPDAEPAPRSEDVEGAGR